MRPAQTIWRLGSVACGLVLIVGCDFGRNPVGARDRRHPPVPLELPPSEQALDASASARVPELPSAIAETLRSLHEQRLPIVAPRSQAARLAFGAGRLLQAATNKVVLRDAKSGDVIADAPLTAVSALAQGSDGSLFALAPSGGVRFAPHLKSPRSFAHVAFFAGADLFPDLQDPARFFVHLPNQPQLYQYAFEAEGGIGLPIEAQFDLPGCVGEVSLLRDGAFVCSTATSIVRKAPRGLKTEFKLPAGVAEPVRLLPAKRLDELYAVSRTGEVVQLRLAAGTPVVARFQLPAPPFAALGNNDALAFVLVSAPDPNQPRHWMLLVTDLAGEPRLRADLPERGASAADDWMEAVIADKNLAISWAEPLVAVGGAEQVRVWDYAQGLELFAR